MKILGFFHLPAPYLVEFLNQIGKHIELTVIFKEKVNKEREDSWLDYNFTNFKAYYLPDKHRIKFLNQFLKQDYDLYWNCDYSNPNSIYLTTRFKLKKITVLMHADGGIAIPRTIDPIIRKVMNMADWFTSSGFVCDEYYQYYHVPFNKIYHYKFTSQTNNDICKNKSQLIKREEYRKKLGYQDDEIICFSIGQQIPRKGYDILAKAAALTSNKIRNIIAGGKCEENVAKIIKDNNIKNIEFIGFKTKEELSEYFIASDIFVLPTRYDIWGLVINEAMSFGLPIISTEKCAAAVQMQGLFDNGIIVPIEDHVALANAIDKLSKDENLRKVYAKRSLDGIQNYTIENMVLDYLVIFNKILGDK